MTQIRPVVGLPTLTWLRAFEAAARTSSFTAAAAELNLTSGAISYQIRALETHLGFALFERLPRGVKLTPMGVAYLPSVRKAFEELADSTVGLFGSSERTQITVHAPVSLAALWLAPRLPAFSRENQSIDVRLSSVIWDNAVLDEATDLEIRYGTGRREFQCGNGSVDGRPRAARGLCEIQCLPDLQPMPLVAHDMNQMQRQSHGKTAVCRRALQ